MALPVPNLDDRTFQDIVNEARRRIPVYTPEWTDHNLSDPGITLIELFSWMTEMTLYRLNKVPDKNYVKFLELLGVRLTPTTPASTEITFTLSAPQDEPVTIPQGTEVSTVRTETEDAIVFTTSEDLTIIPANLEYFLLSRDITEDDPRYDDRLTVLREWETLVNTPGGQNRRLNVFQDVPEPNNAFLLGLNTDIRRSVLHLTLNFAERAAPGIVPSNPPLVWEYYDANANDWVAFGSEQTGEAWMEQDGTRGLNTQGDVVLHIPSTAGQTMCGMREAWWIRCTVQPWSEQSGAYESSPRLAAASVSTFGGSAMATNVTTVTGEILGLSDGNPGQVMTVADGPMLQLAEGETVEVEREDETGWEKWEQVDDFSKSEADDKHFVCDPVSGEIQFGPAIRSPQGGDRRYGATPPDGVNVRLSSYRHGGGPMGNVGPGTLSELKSAIPFVDSITNRRVASGGVDPEDIENAKLRGPQALRTLNRAITQEDFEYLAREASASVRRAQCIQPTEVGREGDPLPGVVRVLLVPTVPDSSERTVSPSDLRLPRELVE